MKKNSIKKEITLFLLIISLIFPIYYTHVEINNQTFAKTISTSTTKKTNLTAFNAKIKRQINKYRKSKNFKSLKIKKDLTAMAKVRAKECAKSFTHKRPNGKSLIELANKKNASEYAMFGEVLAKTAYVENTNLASAIVNAWKKSPSHDKVISRSKYEYIGTSYYITNGIIYVCTIVAYK